MVELSVLWGRRFTRIVLVGESRILALPIPFRTSGGSPSSFIPAPPPRSVDVVVCGGEGTPARETIARLVAEAEALGRDGVPARVVAVARATAPRGHGAVGWLSCREGGIAVQRDLALASTTGDLVVFVAETAGVHPGFLRAHLGAATTYPEATGIAGRVTSRQAGRQGSAYREVGQVRATGFVERHHDSLVSSPRLVAQLPAEGNWSLRRAAADALLGGPTWFAPGAGAEELGRRIFRRGGFLVYEPHAAVEVA